MVRSKLLSPTLLVLGLTLLVTACDSDPGPGDTGQVPGAAANATDVDALVLALALENEALAEILSIFSADGTRALFDPELDWSDAAALDAYDRLDALAAKLRAHSPALREALASLQAKEDAAVAAGQGAGRARFALKLSSFFPSIFGWADGAPKAERENIVKVLDQGGAATRADVYQLATQLLEEGRLGDDTTVDLGASPDEFYARLQSGELDGRISMHNLNKDAANELSTYVNDAKAVGGRPVDVAAKQGAEGLVAGGATYWDLAKRQLGAGFSAVGSAASAAFEQGTALAEGVMEKIEQAEALVAAPIDFVKGELTAALQGRVADFLGEKTALDPDTAGTLVEGLGDDLQGWMRQVTASKEVATTGVDPEDLYGAGLELGGLALENAEALSGALVTWLDEASGTVKTLLSPGPFEAGDVIVLPANVEATVVGLGEGQALTPPKEGVAVVEDQTTPVVIPALPAAQEPEPEVTEPSGVYVGCETVDDGGYVYGCVMFHGDVTDAESTAFLDQATAECLNAGYRVYAGLATEGDADCRAWCSSKEGSYGFKACDTPGEPVEVPLDGPCTGITPGDDNCYEDKCYNCCDGCSEPVLLYECMSGCEVSSFEAAGTWMTVCECL